MENLNISFLGAAGMVTGSKYLLTSGGKTFLIDCGLFQGPKKLRLMNWEDFPIDPATIDVVLLTHGHLDHVGYLPRLVKQGFKGNIWGTAPTLDIARIILEDSAKIQEEEAENANKFGYSKHKKAVPLYDLSDVKQTTRLFQTVRKDEWIYISNSTHARFRYNGHIIGSTFIEFKHHDKMIVFSGDIGRTYDPLLYSPENPEEADVLIIESTYGDRLHPDLAEKQLSSIVNDAVSKAGTILIPSFAVERTQTLMYLLWKLRIDMAIPRIPVYMDSPMGINVLDIFHRHSDWHKLSMNECKDMCNDIVRVKSIDETMRLAADRSAKIIIAGSGMATGGRILTYFEKYLADQRCTILLVGYQAEGTRGRRLLDGAKEIKLRGRYHKVNALVKSIEGLSAHADQAELIQWLGNLKSAPQKIFITHGVLQAAKALKAKIKIEKGWHCKIPTLFESANIDFASSGA